MNSAFDDKYDRLPHAGDFETKSGIEGLYFATSHPHRNTTV